MPSLPTGTVTFFFSDIQGSTRPGAAPGNGWPALLEAHRAGSCGPRSPRPAVSRSARKGTRSSSAFPSAPAAAVSAAVGDAARPGMPTMAGRAPRSGSASACTPARAPRRGGLRGHRRPPSRADRRGRARRPGAALATPRESSPRRALPDGVTLRDLGAAAAQGPVATRADPSAGDRGSAADFPPLKTLDATPNNLPIQLSSFLGREHELAEVDRSSWRRPGS